MTNYGKESLMRFEKQEITGLLQHLHISTTCSNFPSLFSLFTQLYIDYVFLLLLFYYINRLENNKRGNRVKLKEEQQQTSSRKVSVTL